MPEKYQNKNESENFDAVALKKLCALCVFVGKHSIFFPCF